MSHDDARAMVRRYGARQARREAALRVMLLSGVGLGVAALALSRQQANRGGGLATAAHDVAHRVEGLAHEAKARVEGARSVSLQLAQEPLAIAAVGLALGLAASAIWPPTEAERRLLGPARRRLIHQASDLAGEAADQVREALQGALGAVAPQAAEVETNGAEQSVEPAEPTAKPRRRKPAAPPTTTER